MWCVAELNAEYVRKMEDVLATYERPHDATEPVVCVDEKPVTLHDDVRPPIAASPGIVAHRDNEYGRCGTANVFCAVEPKAGQHFTQPTARRSALDFARMAAQIAISYPATKTIHLVLDNLNIHCRKSLVGCYGEECGDYLWKRFSVHYTPKHGSWLNQAEIEISLFSRQCLGRRRIADLAVLQCQAQAWNEQINRAKTKINWQFSRKDGRRQFGYKKNQFKRSENYLAEQELRATIQAATNKSEQFNCFLKWVFFGGEGVITENSRDEQRKVIKHNHLVANCLIFHNVCSLTRIVRELERDGDEVQKDALACISPYLTEHINRFGDYTLNMDRKPPQPDYGFALRQLRAQAG